MGSQDTYEYELDDAPDTTEQQLFQAALSMSLGGGYYDDNNNRSLHRPPLQLQGRTQARSNPIAIRRQDSSDDDDFASSGAEGDSQLETDDFATNKEYDTSRSLPARLLRAPRLGSVPMRGDSIAYQDMLPPPMTFLQNDGPQSHVSSSVVVAGGGSFSNQLTANDAAYGSLRDSHSRGRFLDGPSSYRDKRTGDIRQIQPRVRFRDMNACSSSLPSIVSIGDRIRKNQQRAEASIQQQLRSERQPSSSSLTAMLGEIPVENLQLPPVDDLERQRPFYEAPDDYTQSSWNMLSTSLTGLEVLQNGWNDADDRKNEEDMPPPRHANGCNALFSRSISDPTPHARHSPPAATAAALMSYSSGAASPPVRGSSWAGVRPLSLLLPAAAAPPGSNGGSGRYRVRLNDWNSSMEASGSIAAVENAFAPRDDSSEDPDLEGAFDMDLDL